MLKISGALVYLAAVLEYLAVKPSLDKIYVKNSRNGSGNPLVKKFKNVIEWKSKDSSTETLMPFENICVLAPANGQI